MGTSLLSTILTLLNAVQKETTEYDEKVLDLAQISMLVVIAEQAAKSADNLTYCEEKLGLFQRLLYIFS